MASATVMLRSATPATFPRSTFTRAAKPLGAKEIAALLDKREGTVRAMLTRMVKAQEIRRVCGQVRLSLGDAWWARGSGSATNVGTAGLTSGKTKV